MNLNDINTQIIFTTVPIWIEKKDGSTVIGTGFFYQKKVNNNTSIPYIVTNAHVVENAKKGLISLIKRNDEEPILSDKITVEVPGEMLKKYMDKENDLAIFPIGPILNQLSQNKINIFFRSIDPSLMPNKDTINNLSAVEEITFIGYPSGIYDRKNNTPIVRKGITATPLWNDFDGRQIFLIDAGVYPGSSGSPVFIINTGSYSHSGGITIGSRIFFLGVISKTMQRSEDYSNVYLGLGEVIKSTVLKKFVDRTTKTIEKL
ncbi:MAG: trypsin-like peptidase domain-containing protein [Deltaproteobacteria bacterium]|nr:trypsin-like peptidase domain-containing protein [Deltaproteobacteria bacterium]